MPHVYSTLSNSVLYAALTPPPGDTGKGIRLAVRSKGVLIKGGANVITGKHELYTPRGVRTEVTEDELKLLLQDEVFKLHQKNGYITIEDAKRPVEAAVKNMKAKDKSGQKTPAELAEEAEKARKLAEMR
jgi:hypothetical protein